MSLRERLMHSYNAFMNKDPTPRITYGPSSSYRPDRIRLTGGNERSQVNAIYNRIALDVAAITIEHIKTDEEGRFIDVIDSGLNRCLNLSSNIDQTARAFKQDAVMSMFDEGVVALVPIDTDDEAENFKGPFDIDSWRTGKILDWMPRHVRVQVYNDRTGNKEDLVLPKDSVCIIENPFYTVMNEPNSTVKRLVRKLNILDSIDEQSGSGKLDLIIQLPYVIKSPARQKQAEERRKQIEDQLSGSKYGIAYTDGTEHITQLNRAVENNLMNQIEYLTNLMFSQLAMTQSILDGTADEGTMLNYYNRTVEPIVAVFVDEIKRKILTQTALSQRESIFFYRDPFKLVPVAQIAEISDKFTRNEIATSNEIRQVIGWKPSKDPKADELRNSNLSEPSADKRPQVPVKEVKDEK